MGKSVGVQWWTAKANGVEPHAYLSHLFEKVPYAKGVEDFEALLPWNVKHALHLAGPPWISSHQWFTQSYLSPIAGDPFNAARMHQSR
jgi:hypothetical protein